MKIKIFKIYISCLVLTCFIFSNQLYGVENQDSIAISNENTKIFHRNIEVNSSFSDYGGDSFSINLYNKLKNSHKILRFGYFTAPNKLYNISFSCLSLLWDWKYFNFEIGANYNHITEYPGIQFKTKFGGEKKWNLTLNVFANYKKTSLPEQKTRYESYVVFEEILTIGNRIIISGCNYNGGIRVTQYQSSTTYSGTFDVREETKYFNIKDFLFKLNVYSSKKSSFLIGIGFTEIFKIHLGNTIEGIINNLYFDYLQHNPESYFSWRITLKYEIERHYSIPETIDSSGKPMPGIAFNISYKYN